MGSLETDLIDVFPTLLQFSKPINYLVDIGDDVSAACSVTYNSPTFFRRSRDFNLCVNHDFSMISVFYYSKFCMNFPLHLCTFLLL